MAVDIPAQIRAGIAKAKAETVGMMVDVGHLPVIGRDSSGPIYADNPIIRQAIVEDIGVPVTTEAGTERVATSKLTILDPFVVDDFDIFIVNGVQSNIAKHEGLLDPDGVPYYKIVYLGKGNFR